MDDRPRYMISVAADLVGMHPQTLRIYEQKGLMTPEERKQFLAEWEERKQDPLTMFYSPMVVDAAGRRR